jgi:small-conductance mechanosensitive channel
MNELVQGILNRLLGSDHQTALQQVGSLSGSVILAAIVALITLYAASRVRQTLNTFFRGRGDLGLAILLGRTSYFLILFIGGLIVLRVFGLDATILFASLGVVGLAISLALQDVLKNVFAGIYLLIERPFQVGDTIKVRDFIGVVETIELRTTLLRAEDAVIHVPNAILFSEILVNRGISRPVAKVP